MVTAVLKNPFLVLAAVICLTGGPWKALLAAILVHELGHWMGARLTGVTLRRLEGSGGGFHLDFSLETVSYEKELAVLLAGSLLGVLSVLVCRNPDYRTCALCLNLVNLLPLPGLDGGGVLAALLQRRLDVFYAEKICRRVFAGMGLLLWLGGMWIALRVGPNPTWMLCGMAALYPRKT